MKAEQELGIRKEVAARSIYILSQQGTISLEEPRLPLTFAKYLLNHRSMWFWALASIALITAFSIYLLPQSVPFIYTRFVFGALYVLYLPGFALIQLLYPKNDELSPIHRHVLSIGLSLVLVPIVGLVLNFTPFGIRLDPIFLLLTALTLLLSLGALVRIYYDFKRFN